MPSSTEYRPLYSVAFKLLSLSTSSQKSTVRTTATVVIVHIPAHNRHGMNTDNQTSLESLSSLKVKRFTYPGWRDDYCIMNQEDRTQMLHSSTLRDRFLGMINQQHLYDGDRSHAQLNRLDALAKRLFYPGWRLDVEYAERMHVRFPSLFEDQLEYLARKQRVFGGNPDYGKESNITNNLQRASRESHQRSYAIEATKATSEMACVVCRHSKREYAFVSCGHLCICRDCSICIANLDGRCPLCRCQATHVIKIFV